jgi:mono/diheme cytochrome c family protein
MRLVTIAAAFVGAILISSMGTSYGQERKFDFGKREYDSNCASCHGLTGKGDGPYKPYLTKSPPDLTVLAKNNGGVFPMWRVYAVIDGREVVPGHGGRDMPIWGTDYSVKAAEAYLDVPYPPEAYVRTRILALAEYLSRLQVK